jgi:hypothetical protein
VVGGTEVACEAMGGTHDHHEGQQPDQNGNPGPTWCGGEWDRGYTRDGRGAVARNT